MLITELYFIVYFTFRHDTMYKYMIEINIFLFLFIKYLLCMFRYFASKDQEAKCAHGYYLFLYNICLFLIVRNRLGYRLVLWSAQSDCILIISSLLTADKITFWCECDCFIHILYINMTWTKGGRKHTRFWIKLSEWTWFENALEVTEMQLNN